MIFYFLSVFLSWWLLAANPPSKTIVSIEPPAGFERIEAAPTSFARWLRQLPLKPIPSPVLDFRGHIHKKSTDTTVAAVIDLDVSGKHMQQCMDIIIRLRAEYLWQYQAFNRIFFPLPGGYLLNWLDWLQGYRPQFQGIRMSLNKSTQPDSSRKSFERYLSTLFATSHTQQFYHAYPPLDPKDIQAGDFIVRKGTKGHAILIVDLAVHQDGTRIALIGQGDTPACEFHLLNYRKNNPWFPLDFTSMTLPLPIRKKMSWDGLRRFP